MSGQKVKKMLGMGNSLLTYDQYTDADGVKKDKYEFSPDIKENPQFSIDYYVPIKPDRSRSALDWTNEPTLEEMQEFLNRLLIPRYITSSRLKFEVNEGGLGGRYFAFIDDYEVSIEACFGGYDVAIYKDEVMVFAEKSCTDLNDMPAGMRHLALSKAIEIANGLLYQIYTSSHEPRV